MRVARRDVRIVIANEIALQRDINYPATRGSLKSNNKLLRPVIGLAHIQGELREKQFCMSLKLSCHMHFTHLHNMWKDF